MQCHGTTISSITLSNNSKNISAKKDVLVCATKSLNKLNWTLEMVEKVCFSKRKHFLFAGLHRYERLDHKLRSVCGQCQHFFKSKLTQCNTNAM